jgi:hypothetical protein
MSKQYNVSGTIMDVSLAMVLIALLFAGVYNTVTTIKLAKLVEINKSHICGLTSMMFGPVEYERTKELCDLLRSDLYTEWEKLP